MPDVFKNIADAAGSSSVRRGFADLFSASKAALDEIQAGLGGMLPSMPGMPCLLYTSPSPRDKRQSRMPSSA